MVPGPERTLIEFAYTELTQKTNRLKGICVGEEVGVGFNVAVSVRVGVKVTVELAVGLIVDVFVSVARAVTVIVTDGGITEGVEVGEADGVKIKVDTSASITSTPRRIGMAYLRS